MSVSTLTPRFAGGNLARNRNKAASQIQPRREERPLSFMSRLVQALSQGAERRAAIRALGALDERMLADIGIERGQIETEMDILLARSKER